jgi:hypothetical protein
MRLTAVLAATVAGELSLAGSAAAAAVRCIPSSTSFFWTDANAEYCPGTELQESAGFASHDAAAFRDPTQTVPVSVLWHTSARRGSL